MPGKGGGAGAPVTQVNENTPSAQQQQLMNMAFPWIQQYNEQSPSVYGGQLRAGLNAQDQEAQSMYLAGVPRVSNLAQTSADSQNFMLSRDQLNPETNPYLEGAARKSNDLVTQQLLEKILPNIRGGEQVAGGIYSGGSSRGQMAEQLAGRDAVKEMADATNQLYSNNYQAGLNNISRAQQLNPSVMEQQLFGANVMGAVGGQNRMEEQAGLDESFSRWNLQQQLPYLRASELIGLLGGLPGGRSTTTVQGATPNRPSAFSSGLGGALSGAAAGSAFGPWGAGIGGAGGLLMGLMNR